MTLQQALATIREVGEVHLEKGSLTIRFPKSAASTLEPALAVLRSGKAEAIALLARESADDRHERQDRWLSWAEWFAASSNAAWVTEGFLHQPGKLSAATVRHGLDAYCRKKRGTVQ